MREKSTYLKVLADAIRDLHRLSTIHVQTVLVSILDQENTPVQQDVEIFALMTHSESRKCFAWCDADGRPVILLATSELNSPEQALRTFHQKRAA